MPDVRSIDELFAAVVPQSAAVAETVVERAAWRWLWLYSLTIFSSAFLLFQVEPLIAKLILPWFGGMAAVWSACMLVFQVLLFGGYAYAHLLTSRQSPRKQALIHVLLLAAACATLPILPRESLKPAGDGNPIWEIVLLLGFTVAVPFFTLSATGPLLQAWFAQAHRSRSTYRFYALSNVGSLLALVTYPALFEWVFPARTMATLWSWAFGAFAFLCALCALAAAKRNSAQFEKNNATGVRPAASLRSAELPSIGVRLLWFAFAFDTSVLLLAVTNQVCLDIASVPFLWILPLTLYLLSFIFCFDNDRWYKRQLLMPAAAISLAWVYPMLQGKSELPTMLQISGYFTTLFLCSMVCHGELARRKPAVDHLTSFYLFIAAGGAAGGVFVGIVSPGIFNNYYELHLGLFGCATLMLVALFTDPQGWLYHGKRPVIWAALVMLAALFSAGLISDAIDRNIDIVAAERNFYGVLRVKTTSLPYEHTVEPAKSLLNGQILHGNEYTAPNLRRIATTYYGSQSGIGRILLEPTAVKRRRVGAIGLGAGTIASYARPGDYYRFYEINPAVERLARDHFYFLANCRGTVDVVYGDARLTLEREQPQNLDVLVLDAFSGDAIPVHLLTVEAFQVYLRHLADDGIIGIHISNLHFALGPVVSALCHEHHLACVLIDAPDLPSTAEQDGSIASVWALVARHQNVLDRKAINKEALVPDDYRILWTDDHASLFETWWALDAAGEDAGFQLPREKLKFLNSPKIRARDSVAPRSH